MKYFLLATLAVFATSCATTSGPKPAPKSVSDVNVGDKLSAEVKGHGVCTITVDNIATTKNTPFGIIKTKPYVCGPILCSTWEAKRPAMNDCIFVEEFLQKD